MIPSSIAVTAVLCGMATVVLAGDGLMITVSNDGPDKLMVTVLDRNANPPLTVLSGQTIYGNASLTVSISAGGSGTGHLSWTAISADKDMRTCGRGDQASLNDGDTVHVHAGGECGS